MPGSPSFPVRGKIEEIAEYFAFNVPCMPHHRRHPEEFEDVLRLLPTRGQCRSSLLGEVADLSEKIRQEQHCSKRVAIQNACPQLRDRYGQPIFSESVYSDVEKRLKDADRAIRSNMSRISTDQIVVAMVYGEYVVAAKMYKAALHQVRKKIRDFVTRMSTLRANQNAD